jgi:heat shock protein HtpX
MQNETTTPGRLRSEITEQLCPSCAASIPVHYGYVTWCECGWNLKPYESAPPTTALERLQMRFGDVLGDSLFKNLLRAESLSPSLTISRIAAYALAIPVHLTTLMFAVLGVFLITWGWPYVMAICFGALSFLAAWFTRPRLGRFPGKEIASRERYPVLYGIADDVAAALGTTPVDGIIFSEQYNASMQRLGLRRRKLMTLGVPLIATLNDEERLALIGHELGHVVNGDCNRGFFIGSALSSLGLWYEVVLPDRIIMTGYGYVGLAMIPVNLALYLLAGFLWGWFYSLVHLIYRDSQRAEYLADYLAAEAAGTDAKVRMLAKLKLNYIYEYSVQRAATNGGRPLFAELEYQLGAMPARELERLKRAAMLDRSRIDSTHPPTGKRIEFLLARHNGAPKVTIDAERSRLLAAELAQLHPTIEKNALESYSRGLYY